MTVTMDHKNNNKRRGSWDSKMSVSSGGTRNFRRCGTPSSILSSDSDIRFTRKKLGKHCRCGCYFLAGFLLFLLFAAVAIYIGYTFFGPEPPAEQIFRGTFRITDGDTFSPELADPATDNFRIRSRNYREKLNLLFRRSNVQSSFMGTEVLALDGNEGEDLVVHFNLHFDPRRRDVDVSDLIRILVGEVSLAEESRYLNNVTIDPSSVDVKKSDVPITSPAPLTSSGDLYTTPATAATTPAPPRRCAPVQLDYCIRLPYNITTYPNVFGHKTLKEVRDDVIAFRELVDAECYRMAYEFICQLLQPECVPRVDVDDRTGDGLILPCRSFCMDFWSGCGSRLPARIKDLLDCTNFPEYSGVGSCKPKPGCVPEMQSKALSPRLCDGVVDCEDFSDETTCAYCGAGHLHCGIGRVCIPPNRRCDGKKDCPDGSDERACLSLAPSIEQVTKFKLESPHQHRYFNEGFVIFNEKGEYGKICSGNSTDNADNSTLQTAATSLCKSMSYQKLDFIKIENDTEDGVPYVQMKDPAADEISFVRSSCPNKQVLYVGCSNLECGTQPVRENDVGVEGLSKMAKPGDWPWHAALFKGDSHVCDGTLVSPAWLLTTASCFQGQPKAEWSARLGVVRLESASPWQQRRRIVGMVKSPVEGSTVVMVKLERSVEMTDLVRPACLPHRVEQPATQLNLTQCNTLGWARNREQLQRVQLEITGMAKCENISIATVNSLCTESPYLTNDCNEEEFAGSPMLCLLPDGRRWSLVGISNWRIACSNIGVERPRMYDKIASNIEWIHKTLSAITT